MFVQSARKQPWRAFSLTHVIELVFDTYHPISSRIDF